MPRSVAAVAMRSLGRILPARTHETASRKPRKESNAECAEIAGIIPTDHCVVNQNVSRSARDHEPLERIGARIHHACPSIPPPVLSPYAPHHVEQSGGDRAAQHTTERGTLPLGRRCGDRRRHGERSGRPGGVSTSASHSTARSAGQLRGHSGARRGSPRKGLFLLGYFEVIRA